MPSNTQDQLVPDVIASGPEPKTWRHQRARIAGLTSKYGPDEPEVIEAQRELKLMRLTAAIAEATSGPDRLTRTQRQQLAEILVGVVKRGEPR